MLPCFRKSEGFDGPASEYHGTEGELGVSELRNDDPSCEAWLQAAQEYGLPLNPDFNAATDYGVGRYQLSIKGRWRSSAAAAFLRPVQHHPGLTLRTGVLVSRVLFDRGRAVGVVCREGGQELTFRCDGDVILAAGALQSPQLLQLSGVGPADPLRALGISVVHDAPEVGENLQDHYQARTIVRLKDPAASGFRGDCRARRRALTVHPARCAGGLILASVQIRSCSVLTFLAES